MKSTAHRWALGFCAAALALPATCSADLVWPALVLETGLTTWWIIAVGLLVEFVAILWVWKLPPGKAALITLCANLLSTLLGMILIPLAGVAWEVFPGLVFYFVFGIGTFNPITWTATFILAVLINTFLEGAAIHYLFKQPFGKRYALWLGAANAVSVAVAFANIMLNPPKF
ncbi:MAG: hypothetical protein AMXMBFR84_18900 [Candidatus Hydrogenedentota bacterium]